MSGLDVGGVSRTSRQEAPVFVVGCPRSGTTLLYDMLLSSGGFAKYPAESNVFNLLQPRFGSLGQLKNRKRLLEIWLESKLFKAAALDGDDLVERFSGCKSTGDFLEIFMGAIQQQQNVHRWADNSPEELLYLTEIKSQIPDALILHIVRDGRDVALSLSRKKGFLRPFPWKEKESFFGAGLYWEWIVTKGRAQGRLFPSDYLEIRFEDLVLKTEPALRQLSDFLQQNLDLQHIKENAFGSVGNPNTSFRSELKCGEFNPVGRWRTAVPLPEVLKLESCIGPLLNDYKYDSARTCLALSTQAKLKNLRLLYRGFFNSKLWYKNSSLVRFFRPTMSVETLNNTTIAEDWYGQSSFR